MSAQSAKTLRVYDVATRDPICAAVDMSVQEVGEMLDVNEISGAPVVDGADRLVGVVSKSDVVHCCIEELFDEGRGTIWTTPACRRAWDPNELGVVSDFMSSDPVTARMDETIAEVAVRMADRHVHRVVVLDDEALVTGVLTTMDVIEAVGGSTRRRTRRKSPTLARGANAIERLAA